MTPLQRAEEAGQNLGLFGSDPGSHERAFHAGDAAAIITAFLDAAELDMRTSGAAKRAIENSQHASHLGQARAVITALKEAL